MFSMFSMAGAGFEATDRPLWALGVTCVRHANDVFIRMNATVPHETGVATTHEGRPEEVIWTLPSPRQAMTVWMTRLVSVVSRTRSESTPANWAG